MRGFTAVSLARQPLLLAAAAALVAVADEQIALPNCPSRCGRVTVPHPFGIRPGCHLPGFNLTCDTRRAPPRLLLGDGALSVESIAINEGALRVRSRVANSSSYGVPASRIESLGHGGNPYTIAGERNELVLTGCNVFATLASYGGVTNRTVTGCASICKAQDVAAGGEQLEKYFLANETRANGKKCFGVGCCQQRIPAGAAFYGMELERLDAGDDRRFDAVVPVSMLIAEKGWFDRTSSRWRCSAASCLTCRSRCMTCPKDLGSDACHSQNSFCETQTHRYTSYTAGYICRCQPVIKETLTFVLFGRALTLGNS
ncbi:hypothetical protein ACP4OV_011448 [Aristida adscensionis]